MKTSIISTLFCLSSLSLVSCSGEKSPNDLMLMENSEIQENMEASFDIIKAIAREVNVGSMSVNEANEKLEDLSDDLILNIRALALKNSALKQVGDNTKNKEILELISQFNKFPDIKAPKEGESWENAGNDLSDESYQDLEEMEMEFIDQFSELAVEFKKGDLSEEEMIEELRDLSPGWEMLKEAKEWKSIHELKFQVHSDSKKIQDALEKCGEI